jgi:hypothetical protein
MQEVDSYCLTSVLSYLLPSAMESRGLFGGPTRKIYSPEQWGDLKPIIRELYLDKNWPFKKIATYLRDQSNFEPT